MESFTRAAHTLKGSSRELGAVQLGELADQWEQMGRRQELAGEFFDRIEGHSDGPRRVWKPIASGPTLIRIDFDQTFARIVCT
ncbi:MAG TPA: hypothetical protein DIC52_07895 [Candidatus Latescibacteria bacterium]|nr:hypothetical protein [Candidatus Latescibacterota bacterium]